MSDVISPDLLAALVCPETRQALALASSDLLRSLQSRHSQGELTNREGNRVSGSIDGALIRADGEVVYLILDGIPDLLVEESILVQAEGS